MKFDKLTIAFNYRGRRYTHTVDRSELSLGLYENAEDYWEDFWDSDEDENLIYDENWQCVNPPVLFNVCGSCDDDGDPIETGLLIVNVYPSQDEVEDEYRIGEIDDVDVMEITEYNE